MRLAIGTLLVAVSFLALPRAPVAQQRQMQATIETSVRSRAQVLASSDALPAHIAAAFSEPAAFVQIASGQYLVFDRRAQAVYSIDRAGAAATKIVQVGEERGRITDGDKIRTLQLRAAGPLAPTSLFFSGPSRLLVTPGCYIFDTAEMAAR